MSPDRFRTIRLGLGLTQEELAKALGLGKKTVTQYEIGFRKPGATVAIIISVLGSLPERRAKEFLELLKSHAEKLERESSRRR